MTRPFVPQEVLDAAHARSAARAARDWDAADRIRSEIEAAGWRVVDRGTDFALEPSAPPDIPDGDIIRYGRSESVPSRATEAATARATFVLVAGQGLPEIETALGGVLGHRTPRDQVLVIVDGPESATDVELPAEGSSDEVVRTTQRLGAGAVLNIALRRAIGEIVIFVDGTVVPSGEIVGPLVEVFSDPTVGVVGLAGRRTSDLRRYDEVVVAGDATAVVTGILAFRRSDALQIGPADESMIDAAHIDTWWSLALRAGPEDRPTPLRAVVAPNLAVRLQDDAGPPIDDLIRTRQSKRNFYRLLARFRERTDLLEPPIVG